MNRPGQHGRGSIFSVIKKIQENNELEDMIFEGGVAVFFLLLH